MNNKATGKRILSAEELEAEKRALRELLDSFRTEKETLLDKALDDMQVRCKIGQVISSGLTPTR